MNLSKELKRQRDKEKRLISADIGKNIVFNPGTPDIPDSPPPEYEQIINRFRQLIDTPGSYAEQAGKAVLVKQDESGLEFGEVAANGVTAYYEPLTNGDPENPSILFTPQGDILMGEVDL